MTFKDVAHLYIGCKVSNEGLIIDWDHHTCGYLCDSEYIKPLLYPLSTISGAVWEQGYINDMRVYTSFEVKYLLDNHCDLFDLIESGEAIDVTTLNPNPYNQ